MAEHANQNPGSKKPAQKPKPKPKKPARPEPLLRTPDDELGKVEKFKLEANYARGSLHSDFRNVEDESLSEVSEQIAKSHGIYLEYNRAKTGREKDWMFMVRISVPGGGAFDRERWRVIDEAADKFCNNNPYGNPSIRLTTRQNIQYHWVKKPAVIELIRHIAHTGFFTMNGCGDNTRNVMACPLSMFSDVYDAHAKAHEYGNYFQLPAKPHVEIFAIDPSDVNEPNEKYDYGPKLLNRKFKIAFSAVHRNERTGRFEYDNCVELRTNDVGVAPIVDETTGRVDAYQVYIGGGQGEKNGKPTFAALGQPFGIFTEENLRKGLHDIVKVHEQWGDRKNRHWARLKYVVQAQGIDWYQDAVRDLGAEFDPPNPEFDPGPRKLHHGWQTLPSTGKLAYGAYIECGRLVDSAEGDDPDHLSGNVTGNGNLKAMVRDVMDRFDGVEMLITPNQDALFTNIDPAAKEDFEAALAEHGYGKRKGRAYSTLRVLSGACVGLPTCRLSYTDSEQFEPELLDELEEMGYGDFEESVGITGCERQCFRPATKTIGWVGQGPNMYALKLGGSEDGSTQGYYLSDGENWYLRQTPREAVAKITAFLFDYYLAHRQTDETMGRFHNRIGMTPIIEALKADAELSPLMDKPKPAPYLPEDASRLIAAPTA